MMRVADIWPDGLAPGERCTEEISANGWWGLTAKSRGVPAPVADLARAGRCTLAIERELIEVGPSVHRASEYVDWHAEGWDR